MIRYELELIEPDVMVFDWDKAAQIIKESKTNTASAALEDDWEWTGGTIYENGKPVFECGTFLASRFTTPVLKTDDGIVPCFRMQNDSPDWDSDTVWPESALKILGYEK